MRISQFRFRLDVVAVASRKPTQQICVRCLFSGSVRCNLTKRCSLSCSSQVARFSEKDEKAQFFSVLAQCFFSSIVKMFNFPPLKLLNKVSLLTAAAAVIEQVLGSSGGCFCSKEKKGLGHFKGGSTSVSVQKPRISPQTLNRVSWFPVLGTKTRRRRKKEGRETFHQT